MTLWWLLGLWLAAAAVVAWCEVVKQRYALADRPQPMPVFTDDGWQLTVWVRRAAKRRFREPVVLFHGLANTFAMFEFKAPQNLAAFLTALGFDTYTVDVRGNPGTVAPHWPADATFDDLIQRDVPAVLSAVRADSGSGEVLWVGHSLGGLMGLASAPHRPEIRALCTIGSPVYFELPPGTHRLLRLAQWLSPAGLFPLDWLAVFIVPFAGWFDVRWTYRTFNPRNLSGRGQRALLANTIAPMWRGVLRQLEDWVRYDVFRSFNARTDYRAGAAALTIPIFVVAGSVDGTATASASRKYFEALTSPDKRLLMCGTEVSHAEEYGHGDLVVGERAHLEVYPAIGEWLMARATPV